MSDPFPEVKVTIAVESAKDLDWQEEDRLRLKLSRVVDFKVNPAVYNSNISRYLIFTGEGPEVPYFKMWEKLQTVEIFRVLGPCAVTWVWQSEPGIEPYDAGYYSPEDCEPMLKALNAIQRLSTKQEK